jgi:hypothetical protein
MVAGKLLGMLSFFIPKKALVEIEGEDTLKVH